MLAIEQCLRTNHTNYDDDTWGCCPSQASFEETIQKYRSQETEKSHKEESVNLARLVVKDSGQDDDKGNLEVSQQPLKIHGEMSVEGFNRFLSEVTGDMKPITSQHPAHGFLGGGGAVGAGTQPPL